MVAKRMKPRWICVGCDCGNISAQRACAFCGKDRYPKRKVILKEIKKELCPLCNKVNHGLKL